MIAALGWIGSALVVLSLVQTDVRRLRQISLMSAIVLGSFNLMVAIPSMIALNAVLAVVNGYHLVGRRPTNGTAVTDANERSSDVDRVDGIGQTRSLVHTGRACGC